MNALADVHYMCAIYSQNEKLFEEIENPCKPHQIKQIPLISHLFKMENLNEMRSYPVIETLVSWVQEIG